MLHYPSYMRKWGAVVIGGFLLISLATPVNAAAPKAGATCTKKNATATSAGKLYTCILSGKKLVWNKGVAVAKSNVNPTSSQSSEINLLRTDSRITPSSLLNSLEVCKTTDKSPDWAGQGISILRNGFPRPPQTVSGKKSARILVIPMSFKDLPFEVNKVKRGQVTSSDLETLNRTIPEVLDFYKRISANRFEIKIDVLPKSEWWSFDINQPFSDKWGVPNMPKLLELMKLNETTFQNSTYDAYVFLGGNDPNTGGAIGTGQATFADPFPAIKSGYYSGVLMVGGFDDPGLWFHELGHALFAFEDLYLFDRSSANGKLIDSSVPSKWDIMAGKSQNLLNWNRLLMGWLEPEETRCIDRQEKTTHYLSEFSSSKDPKLLTINLAPGVTLAAEARPNTSSEKGLLLYTINTYTAHGQGPIISQNELLVRGQTKSILGWDITVIDTNSVGVLFTATKTDIGKFVPPTVDPSQPSTNNPVPQTSGIRVSKGEVIPSGFLKGKATWEVQGQLSYRLYVTAVDDFQKVYFETGYVNGAQNPVVVEISGLVCNKELRTVIEFYTEKDGKGVRMSMESRQLSWLSCEDTTKKP